MRKTCVAAALVATAAIGVSSAPASADEAIVAACAATSSTPAAFAACMGSLMTVAEAEKCFASGFKDCCDTTTRNREDAIGMDSIKHFQVELKQVANHPTPVAHFRFRAGSMAVISRVTPSSGDEGAKSAANTQAQSAANPLAFQEQVYNQNQPLIALQRAQ
jgi:hypothetical protein